VLKHRIITALILAPLVLWGIFQLSNQHFAIAFAVFALVGAWEWTALIGVSNILLRVVYVLSMALVFFALYANSESQNVIGIVFGAGVLWWIAAFFIVRRYDGTVYETIPLSAANFIAGFLLLVPTWLALVWLHRHPETGSVLVLYVMLLMWTADSGAYFIGRKIGKRKIAPIVSPGKSWEGAIGGAILAMVLAIFAGIKFGYQGGALAMFVIIGFITVVFSVIGDLLESVYKRRAGKKDSGKILPGHGGILDRIDSLTAAAPMFATGLFLMESFK